MSDSTSIPPLPNEPAVDSFFGRATRIFYSPTEAFESIVRRPNFLAPLIIAMVAAFVLAETMLQKVGAERIVRNSLEFGGRAARMTPEQVDQAAHRAAGITAMIARVAGVIGVPIYLLVIALVGLFIVNLIFGEPIGFKPAFSIVCYSSLVLQVAVILGLVMILLGDAEQFNPENFVPTTVGFFLDPRVTSKALYVLASSFDIFRVWFIALCSIGFSVGTGKKVGTLKIFGVYLGIWILIVLAHAGFATLMG